MKSIFVFISFFFIQHLSATEYDVEVAKNLILTAKYSDFLYSTQAFSKLLSLQARCQSQVKLNRFPLSCFEQQQIELELGLISRIKVNKNTLMLNKKCVENIKTFFIKDSELKNAEKLQFIGKECLNAIKYANCQQRYMEGEALATECSLLNKKVEDI